ncbi:MAG: hypothetical protein KAV82_06030 [Phycisphaerae bacterium]|nr:hypothetical protein [Phycisphaerae bacterium]
MEEKRISKLIRAATEVDELEAALTGGVDTRESASVDTKRVVRWWIVGVPITAVAAVLVWVLLLPPTLLINELAVRPPPTVRGPDAGWFLIDLSLNRAAYIRVVLIDQRHEPWIMLLDDEQTAYVRRIDNTASIRSNREPKPDDPRGAVKAIVVMVIASLGPTPSADELLETISDPVVPSEANKQTLLRELERISADLRARFDCAVRFEAIGQPE